MSGAFRTPLRIDAVHPALAGHFPGHPVVPGVVILERVAAAWRAWCGAEVGRIDAKFLKPLLPGEEAVIEFEGDAARVEFVALHADGARIARGTLGSAS